MCHVSADRQTFLACILLGRLTSKLVVIRHGHTSSWACSAPARGAPAVPAWCSTAFTPCLPARRACSIPILPPLPVKLLLPPLSPLLSPPHVSQSDLLAPGLSLFPLPEKLALPPLPLLLSPTPRQPLAKKISLCGYIAAAQKVLPSAEHTDVRRAPRMPKSAIKHCRCASGATKSGAPCR